MSMKDAFCDATANTGGYMTYINDDVSAKTDCTTGDSVTSVSICHFHISLYAALMKHPSFNDSKATGQNYAQPCLVFASCSE